MNDTLLERLVIAAEIMAGIRQLDDPSKPKPGFAPLPEAKERRTIYAKRDGEIFWHMMSKELNPKTGQRSKIRLAAEDEQSFVGRLTNIEIVETTRKDENSQDRQVLKAYIILDGDKPTQIETNPETQFFRSFVTIASALTPEQLLKSVQIVPTVAKPTPGKTSFETVMFCDIFLPDEGSWGRSASWATGKYRDINWDKYINALISNVRRQNDISQTNGVMGDPKRRAAEAEAEEAEASDDSIPEAPIPAPQSTPAPAIQPAPAIEPAQLEPADLSDLIAESGIQLDRVGWSAAVGRDYLKKTYKKSARSRLTEDELNDFVDYLRSLPTSLSET